MFDLNFKKLLTSWNLDLSLRQFEDHLGHQDVISALITFLNLWFSLLRLALIWKIERFESNITR